MTFRLDLSVQFSRSVVSGSLSCHGLQRYRWCGNKELIWGVIFGILDGIEKSKRTQGIFADRSNKMQWETGDK